MKFRHVPMGVAVGVLLAGLLFGCGGSGSGRTGGAQSAASAARAGRQTTTYHQADRNSDGRIVIDEVTSYIASWKSGTYDDINMVTNAITLWKTGEVYHYDAAVAPPFVPGAAGVNLSTDNVPAVQGTRSFQVPQISGAGLTNATLSLELTNESDNTRARRLILYLTSSDGTFNHTPVVVTALSRNHIEGTATVGNKVYSVVIDISDDGNSVRITITLEGSSGTGQGSAVPTNTGSATADASLMATATGKLQNLLTDAAQHRVVTLANLRAARDAFAAARTSGPNDPAANFGWAVTHLATTAREVAEQAGVSSADLDELTNRSAGEQAMTVAPRLITAASASMFSPAGLVDTIGSAPQLGGASAMLPMGLVYQSVSGGAAASRRRTVLDNGLDTAKLYAGVRDTLVPAIGEAIRAIEVTRAAASFHYELQFTDSNSETQRLIIEAKEADLFAAALDLLSSAGQFCYVYNYIDADFNQKTITAAEVADGVLTPDEWFYPTPFGVLQVGGPARGQAAFLRLQSAVDKLSLAWGKINSANSIAGQNLDDLIPSWRRPRSLSAANRDKITNGLAEMKTILAGKYTINWSYFETTFGNGGTVGADWKTTFVSVNVPAFWNNPPQDLRTILPTLGEVRRGTGTYADFREYLCGTLDGVAKGHWPSVGGSVTLGGLLDPPVTEADLLTKCQLHAVAVPGTGGSYTLKLNRRLQPWQTYTVESPSLLGTWERIRQSVDGGQNWSATTDGYRVTFADTSNWSDSMARAGVWLLNWTHLTMARSGYPNVSVDVYMYPNGTLMRWTHYADDTFGTGTGVVTEYAKVQ